MKDKELNCSFCGKELFTELENGTIVQNNPSRVMCTCGGQIENP